MRNDSGSSRPQAAFGFEIKREEYRSYIAVTHVARPRNRAANQPRKDKKTK